MMSDSICRFMPPKGYGGNIKTVRFVLETDFKYLPQPFIHPVYLLHIVTAGKGVFKLSDKEYELDVGSLFFAFPGYPFEIKAEDDFEYMYISFMGTGAAVLLNDLNITTEAPVFHEYAELIDFWLDSIKRLSQLN